MDPIVALFLRFLDIFVRILNITFSKKNRRVICRYFQFSVVKSFRKAVFSVVKVINLVHFTVYVNNIIMNVLYFYYRYSMLVYTKYKIFITHWS
jgi:hypothetical protein